MRSREGSRDLHPWINAGGPIEGLKLHGSSLVKPEGTISGGFKASSSDACENRCYHRFGDFSVDFL